MPTSIKFTLNNEIITASGSIESNCNGITFINLGLSIATILSYPLQQNQSFTPPCNVGEEDVTNYNVMFESAVADQRLLVIRKNYSN